MNWDSVLAKPSSNCEETNNVTGNNSQNLMKVFTNRNEYKENIIIGSSSSRAPSYNHPWFEKEAERRLYFADAFS